MHVSIALAGSLDSAFTVVIIPVVVHEAVVVNCKQTILFIPDELALSDTVASMSVSHHTAGVHIYKVSVLIININLSVHHIVVTGSLFRAVINILYVSSWNFFPASEP